MLKTPYRVRYRCLACNEDHFTDDLIKSSDPNLDGQSLFKAYSKSNKNLPIFTRAVLGDINFCSKTGRLMIIGSNQFFLEENSANVFMRHGFACATAFGILLYAVAANFERPPLWLTVPAFLILSIAIAARFASISNDNPLKGRHLLFRAYSFSVTSACGRGPSISWCNCCSTLQAITSSTF